MFEDLYQDPSLSQPSHPTLGVSQEGEEKLNLYNQIEQGQWWQHHCAQKSSIFNSKSSVPIVLSLEPLLKKKRMESLYIVS